GPPPPEFHRHCRNCRGADPRPADRRQQRACRPPVQRPEAGNDRQCQSGIHACAKPADRLRRSLCFRDQLTHQPLRLLRRSDEGGETGEFGFRRPRAELVEAAGRQHQGL
ncbi:MAG: hypothetical protein AVDCRST_MAG44-1492, partial [uncultured Sphingomonas sp.]